MAFYNQHFCAKLFSFVHFGEEKYSWEKNWSFNPRTKFIMFWIYVCVISWKQSFLQWTVYFYSIQKTNLPIVICLESFLVNNRLHNFSVFSVNLFFSGLSREAFKPLLKGGGGVGEVGEGGEGEVGGGGGWVERLGRKFISTLFLLREKLTLMFSREYPLYPSPALLLSSFNTVLSEHKKHSQLGNKI